MIQEKRPDIKEMQERFKTLQQMSNTLCQSLQYFKL
jgi:hypothetical protein